MLRDRQRRKQGDADALAEEKNRQAWEEEDEVGSRLSAPCLVLNPACSPGWVLLNPARCLSARALRCVGLLGWLAVLLVASLGAPDCRIRR